MNLKNSITTTKEFLWGAYKTTTAPIATAISGNSNKIISQIVSEFADRSRSDIKKWRSALAAFEDVDSPKSVLLQDLIRNLMTDGHLMAQIQIRKSATLSKRFMIIDKAGQEVEERTELLQTEWFYTFMEHMLDSVFFGYTVLELTDPATMKWELLPRRNIIPAQNKILFEAGSDLGLLYNNPAFARTVIWRYNMDPHGIINDIVPQLIWKRNAQQVWADFSERFGIPLISAETSITDGKELKRIENMMRQLGRAAQAVLPENTKITIHDAATKGDPHKVFLEQITITNNEIGKRIVGGTMLTDDGSSLSQSEVHERTLDEKISENDRRMVEFTVNGKLIPLLRTWGFAFQDGDRFIFDRSEELSMSDHWTIVNGVLTYYDVDQEWVSRRFNIPISGKKNTASSLTTTALSANFR
jgi:phage gp29-like protein